MDDYASVRYVVDDVQAAIDFYTEHLGFTVLSHPAPPFADAPDASPCSRAAGRSVGPMCLRHTAQLLAGSRAHARSLMLAASELPVNTSVSKLVTRITLQQCIFTLSIHVASTNDHARPARPAPAPPRPRPTLSI